MGKLIVMGTDSREKIKVGVDKLADAVKVTLGPRGRNVAIERASGGPPLITKDGVTVARYINLDDRLENMGAQLVKSVASDANAMAGDGTTTATVLAQEIYNRGLKMIAAGNNPVLLKKGIDLATEAVIAKLKALATEIDDEESLKQVAIISSNNDHVLGAMIAQAVSAVGNDGVITVEEATGSLTEVKYTDGLKLNKGWLNEAFINNPAKLTCELDYPYILLIDGKVKNIRDLVSIINKVIEANKSVFMIFKEFDQEVLSHIVLNKVKGVFNCCVMRAPGFGDHRKGFFDDIATITGAKVFSDTDLSLLETSGLEVLGIAKKVICGPNMTTIIDGQVSKELVQQEVMKLKQLLSEPEVFEHQKEVIRARVSRLTGGVAIFKVGGKTESEVREKKDRVEDAINAVRSAIEEGVVPGGGAALLHCISDLDKIDKTNLLSEEVMGINVIKDALKAPFHQILENAGMEEPKIYEYMSKVMSLGKLAGYDALKMELVDDMIWRGIIDPVKVVRSSLEHASSASGTLLTTEASIINSDFELNE
jgi:chaperonin GroEL